MRRSRLSIFIIGLAVLIFIAIQVYQQIKTIPPEITPPKDLDLSKITQSAGGPTPQTGAPNKAGKAVEKAPQPTK
jgi:hypothetical protein